MPISAKPAKKPARGPSVAPASANTEPAELKCRVSRTKPYDTNITPIVAIRNASGTARPISPATAVPLSAMAAVGAMIASDSAIASKKRSSRRRPEGCPSLAIGGKPTRCGGQRMVSGVPTSISRPSRTMSRLRMRMQPWDTRPGSRPG